MIRTLSKELENHRRAIEETARKEGLDPFETIFELIDYGQINEFAAYGGFPQR